MFDSLATGCTFDAGVHVLLSFVCIYDEVLYHQDVNHRTMIVVDCRHVLINTSDDRCRK